MAKTTVHRPAKRTIASVRAQSPTHQAAAARTEPALRAVSVQAFDGLFALSRSAIAELEQAGLLEDGLDTEVEAARLHALIDGLAVHLDLHSERMPVSRCRQVVSLHLRSLMRAPDTKTR